ncbi:MAG: 2-phospho-L-lactate transferase [Dehalococcoidia bacterium]
MITVLAGGVGAARFLQGLLAVHPFSDVTIVSNVGDDTEVFGLHVSPDIDIVLYHLAGLADEEQGFGVRGDTFDTLEALSRFGYDTWFRLGDRDFATCITRSHLLRRGLTLAEATAELARALGVPATITPATNDPLRTKVRTDDGLLDFQDYFVRRRAADPVREVIFEGIAESARPAPGVLDAIAGSNAVLLTPSNPLLSIAPILAVPGLRDALRATGARIVAVSPIVGGRAIKGPAARMLRDQGLDPSATTVARFYEDFLDGIVIDQQDAALAPSIETIESRSGQGLAVTVTDTIMATMDKKAALARAALAAAGVSR